MSTSFNRIDDLTYWVQQTIPQIYDDSLSFYEVINKCVNQINTIGELTNDLADSLEQVLGTELASAVTDQLTIWKNDGTLEGIIADGLLEDMSSRLEDVENRMTLTENAVSGKVDQTTFTTELNKKANSTDMSNALSQKANLTDLNGYVQSSDIPSVHVQDGGIFPVNGDNADLLQTFINNNAGKIIQFGIGTYNISKPIRIPQGTEIRGQVGWWNNFSSSTLIKKTTNTTDSKYNVDAIFIFDYPSGYAMQSTIRNINCNGLGDATRTQYGVYWDKGAFITLDNVNIQYCATGVYTTSSWQSLFRGVSCRNCDYGIQFKSPTSSLTGTSNHYEKCFMSYIKNIGYDIYGLTYSTFTSCACDHTDLIAYAFEQCDGVVMNGCGAEYSADSISNWSGFLTVNGFYNLHPKGIAPSTNSAQVKSRQGAYTVMNACKFQALETPTTDTYNEICDGGAFLQYNGCQRPTGGKTTLTPGGGAVIVEIGKNGLVKTP